MIWRKNSGGGPLRDIVELAGMKYKIYSIQSVDNLDLL